MVARRAIKQQQLCQEVEADADAAAAAADKAEAAHQFALICSGFLGAFGLDVMNQKEDDPQMLNLKVNGGKRQGK